MRTAAPPRRSQAPILIPDQYVVVLRESFAKPVVKQEKHNKSRQQKAKDNQPARDRNLQKVKDVLAKNNIKEAAVRHFYADVLVGFSARLSETEVGVLRSAAEVEAVDQDYKITLAQFFTEASANEHGQYFVDCNVASAGGPVDGTGKETWIWILDTGIDTSHPDLNVQKDAPFAETFIGGDSFEDDNGHGTHVAGIAAAKSNTVGPTGVSAGATVVPVKVMDEDGSGFLSDVIAGLDHVAVFDIPNDVVNLSVATEWGDSCATSTDSRNRAMRTAVANLGWAGTWVCIAAGNHGSDVSDCGLDANTVLPACVNSYRIYTVAALDCHGGGCAFYSAWGTSVDWVAVGDAYSTFKNGGYAVGSGTSMATPVVAGVIHARGGAPVSSGTVNCCGRDYRKANVTSLSTLRYDVDLKLERLEVANVRDGDGTEDLFGRFDFKRLVALTRTEGTDRNFWRKTKEDAIHVRNGNVAVSKSVNLINNLSFDELRHIELRVGGRLADEEGVFSPRIFTCQECSDVTDDYGTSDLKFISNPSTLASISTLVNDGSYHYLRFDGDSFFKLNYYESNNQNDGWVKALWKVKVKPHP